MKKAPDLIFKHLARHIGKALQGAFPNFMLTQELIDQWAFEFVMPPPSAQGAVAFGCFRLAKELKKNPNEVAIVIKEQSDQLIERGEADQAELFEATYAVGPYFNMQLKNKFIWDNFGNSVLNGDYFLNPLVTQAPKTMIEFSQPNTHKELHVGHMRNACLGDSLVKIKRALGIEIISATFPGDVGAHVAKCLWYLKYHNQEPIPESNKGEWLGRMYSKAHLKLESDKGNPQEQINKEQVTSVLKELEQKQGYFYNLWQETRQWSVELMNRIYAWSDIKFDVWYWESEVDQPSRQYAQLLLEQGKLIKSEGAVGMDLTDKNLGFCMLLKSDGTGLYATKDIELARRKFEQYQVEKSIYVVDLRQALHFSQVFEALKRLGFNQAENCYHLQYNFVELPDGAMSSRKGNIVPVTQLIDKMEQTILSKYLIRYQNEWTQDELNLVARQVAQGAIKYGMIKIDTTKKIVFDMEEWLRIDGDSGPFIQYAGARINSILRKFELDLNLNKNMNLNVNLTVNLAEGFEGLTHQAEEKLMAHLIYYHDSLLKSGLQDKPHLLTTYLYELAKKFNFFYHECSISQAENEKIKKARLNLAAVTGKILEHGLSLIGISVPQRM